MEQIVVVLAMHGAPPTDLPEQVMADLFGLHARLEHAPASERAALEARYAIIDAKVRAWPRTASNDPFHAASQELARALSLATGYQVIVGFNEFCGPNLDEALDQAVHSGGQPIVVITPMMTRGGEHSEIDIPEAIQSAEARHPGIQVRYVWPFEVTDVAQFLAANIERCLR